MQTKDYLLRQVTAFLEAINQIVNSIDKKDIEGAKIQIAESYSLLNNKQSFFLKASLKDILTHFKSNKLNNVKLLAQLQYYDAITQENTDLKKLLLEKSLLMLDYYQKNSAEFDYNLMQLKQKIKTITPSTV